MYQDEKQLKKIDLLLEREKAFIRIREIEQRVNSILGKEYPFPALPDLLSTIPKGKRMGTVRKAATARKLRSLRKDEYAYRVVYRYQGTEITAIEYSYEMLQTLLQHKNPFLEFIKIETIRNSPEGDVFTELFCCEKSE